MTRALGVGVLYNRALTELLLTRSLPVDYVEIIPDRCWSDRGLGAASRFREHAADVAVVQALSREYPLVAHGVGLSIASVARFDTAYLEQLAVWRDRYGLRWVSDHLAAVRTSPDGVADHHAGIALPLPWDEDLLDLLTERTRRAGEILGRPLLLENGVVYTPVVDTDMSEVEFLNRLTAGSGCRLLLDLHNLLVNVRNLGVDGDAFLRDLDLTAVEEIHVAGGNDFHGAYLDSHAGPCPAEVWRMLEAVVPRAPNLRGVTFEFDESYFPGLGADGVRRELARARDIWTTSRRENDVTRRVPAGDR
ncbi:DUF692 family multinuclear iron-containing protein [Nonomuraea sp. NPDC000554]|uniref:DUF692 domain-containing protein n=1 Tax=Nonomuraea sp. NPDC000554 TaxID=3154259 RepID=UPI003323A83E